MDEIDRKILIALDKDSRLSNSRIAKLARTSKDIVNYRIAKLQRENILTGFYAMPVIPKIGFRMYKLLLKFHSLSKEKEEELIEWLEKYPTVVWVESCDGAWNTIVTLSAKDFVEIAQTVKDAFAKFGKYISKKEILTIASVRMFNEKYLYPKGQFVYEKKYSMFEKIADFDDKDKIIMMMLAKNSRASSTEIAKKIKITPEATAKRLKNLIKGGFFAGFKPRINFTKLGYEYFHVFISTKSPAIEEEIINFYKSHPDCVYILEHVGYYDMHLEFVMKSTQHFREVLRELRDKFGDKIHDYEPLQIYAERKFNLVPA